MLLLCFVLFSLLCCSLPALAGCAGLFLFDCHGELPAAPRKAPGSMQSSPEARQLCNLKFAAGGLVPNHSKHLIGKSGHGLGCSKAALRPRGCSPQCPPMAVAVLPAQTLAGQSCSPVLLPVPRGLHLGPAPAPHRDLRGLHHLPWTLISRLRPGEEQTAPRLKARLMCTLTHHIYCKLTHHI